MWEPTSGVDFCGVDFCGVNTKTQKRSSNLEIMFYGFAREKINIWASSRKDHLPNNIVLLVFVKIFEPNLTLVNVNKLKPYKYVDQILKGI
jgi:hypothetical protein